MEYYSLFEIIQQSIKESNTYDLADKYLSVQFIYDDAFERYQANITFNRELFALENYTKILYKDETVERIFQEIYPNIYTGVAALDILNFISWEIPDLNTAKKGENVTLHWVIKEELLNKYFSGHYNPISITYVVTD